MSSMQEKELLEQQLRIQRQIAFASGFFQGDVTIRTLLESLAEGVVIIDNSGTILLVNTRAEQMFGYPKKDLIGKPHAVLIPERFRTVHEEHQAHFFAEPRIRPMGQLLNLAGRRRDGSEFPLEISLSHLETINGVLVLAFISDITLRQQYESHLRESEELSHILIEGVLDHAIFMLDILGNVLNWNEGAERLTGYRKEEIVGRHFSCFYPEEVSNTADKLKTAAAEGRVENEGWLLRKDGSRFWADVIITALRDENGNIRGFSNITRDISERKRAEEELRESQIHYRTLFDSIDEGFCIIEVIFDENDQPIDYRFLETNPSFEIQTGLSNVQGKRIRELAPKHEEHWFQMYGRIALTGEPVRFQNQAEQLHGWYDVYAFRYGQPENRQVAILFNNISDRKRADEEIERLNTDLAERAVKLEDANRELETFSYSVSHDLRVPLSVISGYVQLVQQMCGDTMMEKCREYLPEISKGVSRMTGLIDALLNFSRASRSELRYEAVDLSAVAKEIVAELLQTAPERRLTIRIAEEIEVRGDAGLLRVALGNIIGNAWKYTSLQEEAVIEFGVTAVGEATVYYVRDNGPGFDMADAEKLFVPFQRLAVKAEFAGHGIGLATVERIINRHGGRVWAEGGVGRGATFYFTLGTLGQRKGHP